MAENKENDERKAQIAEVNKHIREGINQWADIMLTADADQWAYDLKYFPRDLMNAVLIYQHVASNIGIKAGRIDEEKAVEFGQRLRQLVIDMTGYDPHEFWKDPKNFEPKTISAARTVRMTAKTIANSEPNAVWSALDAWFA